MMLKISAAPNDVRVVRTCLSTQRGKRHNMRSTFTSIAARLYPIAADCNICFDSADPPFVVPGCDHLWHVCNCTTTAQNDPDAY